MIKIQNPELDQYFDAMQKLDILNQLYPERFMINQDDTIDEMLLRLIDKPESIGLINQLTNMNVFPGGKYRHLFENQ